MVGTIYKYFLDQLRSIDSLTHLIWGFRVHNKLQPITWDLSSIVLKKAFDIYTNRDDLHFLDMGCGQVALLGQYFKKTHSSAIVTSVDIYEDMVACAKYDRLADCILAAFPTEPLTSDNIVSAPIGRLLFLNFV